MFRITRLKQAGLGAVVALTAMTSTADAQCLTTPSATVGNSIFGATVQTFIGLGINPATTCIENGLWIDPSGFTLGSYVGGGDGFGYGYDPTTLGAYNTAGSMAANANARDFYWVQDVGNQGTFGSVVGGLPSKGIIWDLGGQANQLAVFVFVDHGPLPQEVLENTAWLSNNPLAADGGWTQASLVHVYGGGWSPDPNLADGFVAVYQLPSAATFRYASVTWGGPGSIHQDGDNEIDAVGGLNIAGGGIGGTVTPEPSTVALFGAGLFGVGFAGRRRRRR
ncbi:MAG: PEP-CTERM sorting domain-containing protein [Gemmatimonadaceae bacterium]